MGSLSPIHWLLVIVVLLLVFGPTRLAGAGKGLGEGIKAFKKGLTDEEEDAAKKAAEESKQLDKTADKADGDKAPAKSADEKPA